MKSLILASALVVASTAAQAEGVSGIVGTLKPDATVEYAFNSKAWSGDVGVSGTLAGITVRPSMDWS